MSVCLGEQIIIIKKNIRKVGLDVIQRNKKKHVNVYVNGNEMRKNEIKFTTVMLQWTKYA